MSRELLHGSKVVSHLILVVLSVFLSVNLFIQFSNRLFVQILFGSLAVALETIKIYLLILTKTEIQGRLFFRAFPKLLVYLGLAGISLLASVGFALVAIEEQSLESIVGTQRLDTRIEYLQEEYESNMRQIEIVQGNATALEFSAVERSEQANEQVRILQDANRSLIEEIQTLYEEKHQEEAVNLSSNDMFSLLGDAIGLDGLDMRFYLMLFLVFFLEVSIAITAETVTYPPAKWGSTEGEGGVTKKEEGDRGEDSVDRVEKRPNVESYPRIMEYIEALFSEGGSRLVPDSRISESLNMPIPECAEYRAVLQGIHYKGRPMIIVGRGGTKPSYKMENIKKIVQFHIDSLS